MASIRGTLKLAVTKLRTRKLRLVITVGVTSLLFCTLFFAMPVARGVFNSIEQFGKEGLGKRYIVQATLPSQGAAINNPDTTERALQIHTDTIAQRKAAAKRLGITYDAATEPSPVTEVDTPTGKMRNLNVQHPAAKAAVKEYLSQRPLIGSKELREAASTYRPTGFYESKQFQNGFDGGQLQILKNGQENPIETSAQSTVQNPLDLFIFSWTSLDDTLIQPFVLPGKSLDVTADGSIPLVIPFSAAENLLDIEPLPNNASAEATIEHVQNVRSKAADLHFDVCYRNRASADLVAAAVSARQEIERNKNNPDYQRPSLQYGLSTEACSAPTIIRDTRTGDEKALAAKETQLNQTVGIEQPAQQKLRFVIAGISPDKKDNNASNVNQIIGSVVNSSLGYGWYMPSSAEKQSPLIAHLFTADAYYIGLGHNYYVEFGSADTARAFINEKGCSVDSAMRSEDDGCTKSGKLFTLAAFGSNTVGLESLKQQFNKLFSLVLLVIAIVASVVTSSTIGKMVADSRRETAVFRAIGAKRSDITGIYLGYVTLLSFMVVVASCLIGTLAAYMTNVVLAPTATAQAIAVYSAQNTSLTFSLFKLHWQDTLLIGALIIVVGYAAAVLPLMRNLRRNPIQDMRDDS